MDGHVQDTVLLPFLLAHGATSTATVAHAWRTTKRGVRTPTKSITAIAVVALLTVLSGLLVAVRR